MEKTEQAYKLNIQLFGEENPAGENPAGETKEPAINMEKFNDSRKPAQELTREEELDNQLKEALALVEEERNAKEKFKEHFNKASSELSGFKKQTRKEKETQAQENEELENARAELKAIKVENSKREAMYNLRDSWGITQDLSEKVVSGLFFEDTSEVSVPLVIDSFGEVLDSVKNLSYEQGYETAMKEVASGKPRSINQSKDSSYIDTKMAEFYKKRNIKQ